MKDVRSAVLVLFALALINLNVHAIEPLQKYQPKTAARIFSQLEEIGSGQNSLVAVKLKDKSVASGFLEDFNQDAFTVIDKDSGSQQVISYSQVDRLEGANLETGKQVHHGGGIRSKITRSLALLVPGHTVPVNSYSKETTLIIGIVLGVLLAIILAKAL